MITEQQQACDHSLIWIDEGACQCEHCGIEKVRLRAYGPLYTITEDGALFDWRGNEVSATTEVRG